jgi:hypothetical protein
MTDALQSTANVNQWRVGDAAEFIQDCANATSRPTIKQEMVQTTSCREGESEKLNKMMRKLSTAELHAERLNVKGGNHIQGS